MNDNTGKLLEDSPRAKAMRQLAMLLPNARLAAELASSRYPEWFSKRRCKGQRSRSLKIRSNRRKAAKR